MGSVDRERRIAALEAKVAKLEREWQREDRHAASPETSVCPARLPEARATRPVQGPSS